MYSLADASLARIARTIACAAVITVGLTTVGSIAQQHSVQVDRNSSAPVANPVAAVLASSDVHLSFNSALPYVTSGTTLLGVTDPLTITPATEVDTLSGSTRQAILTAARLGLGHAYVWGGTSFAQGWDCSGFAQWAYRKAGISLPRTEQWLAMRQTTTPLPGDLVVQNADGPRHWAHVGIYLGGGMMISALNPTVGTVLLPVADTERENSTQYFTLASDSTSAAVPPNPVTPQPGDAVTSPPAAPVAAVSPSAQPSSPASTGPQDAAPSSSSEAPLTVPAPPPETTPPVTTPPESTAPESPPVTSPPVTDPPTPTEPPAETSLNSLVPVLAQPQMAGDKVNASLSQDVDPASTRLLASSGGRSYFVAKNRSGTQIWLLCLDSSAAAAAPVSGAVPAVTATTAILTAQTATVAEFSAYGIQLAPQSELTKAWLVPVGGAAPKGWLTQGNQLYTS